MCMRISYLCFIFFTILLIIFTNYFIYSFYIFLSNVTFLNHDNHETTVKAQVGDSILKVAHENNINIEGTII